MLAKIVYTCRVRVIGLGLGATRIADTSKLWTTNELIVLHERHIYIVKLAQDDIANSLRVDYVQLTGCHVTLCTVFV